MEVRKMRLCNPSLPSTLLCMSVSWWVWGWGNCILILSYSPVCPHEAILELKGGRAGKVVKCQVANPSRNQGRFTWSLLLNRRECPRNEMFKKPLKIQLTPASGSSECSWSVGMRKESSSSIRKQSWVTTWWGLSLIQGEVAFSCWEGGGKEAWLRHGCRSP